MYLLTSIVKYFPFFFKHSISSCKSESLSIERLPTFTAWLKEWASNILTSWLTATHVMASNIHKNSPYMTYLRRFPCLFSWVKKTNLREKWDAKVGIFCILWQLYPPLQSSSKFFMVPSDLLPGAHYTELSSLTPLSQPCPVSFCF